MTMHKMAESFQMFCGHSAIFNESLLIDNWWPEFTPCFQNTLLVWVPCGWLWLTLPIYLGYMCKDKDSRPLPVNMLNTSKMFFSIFLSFICIMDVMKVVTDGEKEDVVTAFYVTKGLQAVTFLLVAILVQLERKRGFITSGVQFIFWLMTSLAGVVPVYIRIIQQLLVAILVQLERKHGFITSGVQFIFWLMTSLAGVVPVYIRIIQQLQAEDFVYDVP